MPDPTVDAGPRRRSFAARLVLMPVHPGVWREAAATGVAGSLAAIAFWAVLLYGGLGALRGDQFSKEGITAAGTWDSKYDPIVIDKGTVSVAGPRILRYDLEGSKLVIVDPGETVAESDITASEYVLVRKDRIINKRSFGRPQELPMAELPWLSTASFTIEGGTIRGFFVAHRRQIVFGMAAFLALFGAIGALAAGLVYALPVAAMTAAFPSREGRLWVEGYKVALAASTGTIPIKVGVALLAFSVPCYIGLVIWPALTLAFAMLAFNSEAPAA